MDEATTIIAPGGPDIITTQNPEDFVVNVVEGYSTNEEAAQRRAAVLAAADEIIALQAANLTPASPEIDYDAVETRYHPQTDQEALDTVPVTLDNGEQVRVRLILAMATGIELISPLPSPETQQALQRYQEAFERAGDAIAEDLKARFCHDLREEYRRGIRRGMHSYVGAVQAITTEQVAVPQRSHVGELRMRDPEAASQFEE